jgi:hypothetical protein
MEIARNGKIGFHVRMGKRKTRKNVLRGGEFLGEGAQGKAYNAGCGTKGDSLCTLLTESAITEITLYTEKGPVHIKSPEDISEFVNYTKDMRGAIAKLFKYKGKTSKMAHDKLLEEIDSNKRIATLYGKEAERFTTVAPIRGYKDHTLYGAYLKLSGKPDIYTVFGLKCNNKYTMHLKRLLLDILGSLVILNAKDYYHNDIKLDNMVQCGDMYKLIDWGASVPARYEEKVHGSLLTTSPMRWYTFGYNQFISTSIIGTRTYYGNSTVYKSPIFQETVARINKEFYAVMKTTTDRETLFRRYKDSYDVFMLGLTALHAVILHKLDYESYRTTIERMTSLQTPLNASEAMHIVARLP